MVSAASPLKPGDTDGKKLAFINREVTTISQAITGKSAEELKKRAGEYQLPDFSNIIRKGPGDKISYDPEAVDNFKLAAAFSPREQKDGIRDFRAAQNLDLAISASGNVTIKTERGMPAENYTYNPKKLFLSMLAESRDGDKEWTVQPYPHLDGKGHIASKSLLIFNDRQRTIVREFLKKEMLKQLK